MYSTRNLILLDVGLRVVVWSVAESAVSIMAASIPILRALVKQSDSVPMGYYDQTGGSIAYLNRSIATAQSNPTQPVLQASRPAVNMMGPNIVPREKKPAMVNILSGEVNDGKGNWDDPDKMSYEMASYGTEARPVDFTA